MNAEMIQSRFAVMNNAYAAYSFDYYLDSLAELGLNQIDLWGGVQHFDPFDGDSGYVAAFRSRIRRRGMRIIAYTPELLAYPFNFASPDQRVRKESVAYARRNIEICAELECPLMLLSPGWGLLDVPIADSRAWSDDCLAQLGDSAQSYGVQLALEHLTPQSSNLLTCRDAVVDTLNRIGHPMLGAVLDLGQMSLFGERVEDYTQTLGERLVHVHIMDGDPACHLAFGDGILPLEEYFKALTEAGYRGCLTLEINDGRYARNPHGALQQCVDALRKWSVTA